MRGDVAFAQSLHETGFFKYGGIVLPTQNNYAGIGALNGNAKGQAATFPDPRTGVRAQIQHLKAYASKAALVNGCVDPRFSLVTRGSAQYVEWLGASDNPNGKGWAVPGKGYGSKIVALLGQIMAFEVPQTSTPSEPEEQEPEFPAYQLEGLGGWRHQLPRVLAAEVRRAGDGRRAVRHLGEALHESKRVRTRRAGHGRPRKGADDRHGS